MSKEYVKTNQIKMVRYLSNDFEASKEGTKQPIYYRMLTILLPF